MSFTAIFIAIIAVVIAAAAYSVYKLKRLKSEYDASLKSGDNGTAILKGRLYYEEFNRQNKKNQIHDMETRIMNDLKIYRHSNSGMQ